MKSWKKNSWRKYPVKHIPEYPDKKELDKVLDKIGTFPPLVFAGETRHLKSQLGDVVDGKAFLLQGGDCAESFAEFNPDNIRDTFKLMLHGISFDLFGIITSCKSWKNSWTVFKTQKCSNRNKRWCRIAKLPR